MLAVAVKLDLGSLLAVIAAVLRARRDFAFAAGVRAFVLLIRVSHRSPPSAELCDECRGRGCGYVWLSWQCTRRQHCQFPVISFQFKGVLFFELVTGNWQLSRR